MRKLGAALGVEAMSLYNHVANKDDVLDGVLDHVLREVPLPDPTWPGTTSSGSSAAASAPPAWPIPGVLPMFGARPIRTVEGHAPLEAAFDILRNAGLDGDAALDAFLSMASFVLGFVLIDMGGMRQVADGRAIDPSDLSELAADEPSPAGRAAARRCATATPPGSSSGASPAARRPPPPDRAAAGLTRPDPGPDPGRLRRQ